MELTQNEKKILKAARNNEYCDGANEPVWVHAVIDNSGLTPHVARGTIASLVKKELVNVWNHEPGPDGRVLMLTGKGIDEFNAIPKALTPEEYAQKGSGECPFCHSHETNGDTFEIFGNEVHQAINCLACGEEWTDVYELKGYRK